MIRTSRLILRQWQASDLPAYAALNADPEVRRFWPSTLTREDSDKQAEAFQRHIEQHGFGFWAVEVPGVAPFVGMTGLAHVALQAPFTPAVEAGWRFAREHWGHGYATEAAGAALAYGFEQVGLPEIVAYAAVGNTASFRVMERIGMTRDMAGDFDLPRPGSAPRPSALYRIRRDQWDPGSAAGVEFITENGGGAGVRLRKAVP